MYLVLRGPVVFEGPRPRSQLTSRPGRPPHLGDSTTANVASAITPATGGLLALPWELMHDPALGQPLALDAVAMDRSLPAAEAT